MPRKTEKNRRTLHLRFSPKPDQAREERKAFEDAYEMSGEPSRNAFIKKIVMRKVREMTGRSQR